MATNKKHTSSRNQPTTKGDVADVVDDAVNGLRGEMKQWKDEIIQHFDVVAENIHRDVLELTETKLLLCTTKFSSTIPIFK